jgi:hypothetical protein
MSAPTIHKLTRHAGIAGQFSMTVTVEYPNELPMPVTFVGSVYGGPVVMAQRDGSQVFVTDPARFGSFADRPTEWVARFFGAEGAES